MVHLAAELRQACKLFSKLQTNRQHDNEGKGTRRKEKALTQGKSEFFDPERKVLGSKL